MSRVVFNLDDAIDIVKVLDKSIINDHRFSGMKDRITSLLRFKIADSFARETDPTHKEYLARRRAFNDYYRKAKEKKHD